MKQDHPARYALVELENIHDPAISFSPIHRVIKGIHPEELLMELGKHFSPGWVSYNSYHRRRRTHHTFKSKTKSIGVSDFVSAGSISKGSRRNNRLYSW